MTTRTGGGTGTGLLDIECGVRIESGLEAESGMIVISVIDEGPGIPEHEQSQIFERFYRSPRTGNRVPGTGMGLAIAREILRLHGGDISVKSSQGAGTEFCVSVPVDGVGEGRSV